MTGRSSGLGFNPGSCSLGQPSWGPLHLGLMGHWGGLFGEAPASRVLALRDPQASGTLACGFVVFCLRALVYRIPLFCGVP